MKRLVLLSLILILPLSCQVPEYVTVGNLQCGMMRVNSTNVQTWCRNTADKSIVYNALHVIKPSGGQVISHCNYPNGASIDSVTCSFIWDGKVMRYECAGNNSMIKTGRLY